MIDNWLGISQTDISIKLFKLVEIVEVLAYYYSFIYVIWQIVQIVLWDEQACLVEIVGVLAFGQSCTFSRDSWQELKQTRQQS